VVNEFAEVADLGWMSHPMGPTLEHRSLNLARAKEVRLIGPRAGFIYFNFHHYYYYFSPYSLFCRL